MNNKQMEKIGLVINSPNQSVTEKVDEIFQMHHHLELEEVMCILFWNHNRTK